MPLNRFQFQMLNNIQQMLTQEFLYGNDEIKRRDHFQIGSEGMSKLISHNTTC